MVTVDGETDPLAIAYEELKQNERYLQESKVILPQIQRLERERKTFVTTESKMTQKNLQKNFQQDFQKNFQQDLRLK